MPHPAIAKAREALEFYANGWGYMDGNTDMTDKAKRGPCREWHDAREHIPVMRDFGDKARAALRALDEAEARGEFKALIPEGGEGG